MTDITVSRELLRQVLNEYEFAFAPTVATKALRAAIELAIADFEHISAAGGRVEFVERRIAALRAALAETAPVQEPVAFVSPDDLEDMRGPEYAAGAYFRMRATPAGKYVQPIYTAPQPDRIAQLEAANTNLFEQGQKMYKRIQELEMDCKIGAQEMVKAYEEIDNLKAQVSWQKPVAWCQLGLGGKSIAYFDGKPMIMTGHVGNQHHPTPLFTAQPQRFAGKAVKLSEDEIQAAWASDNEWMRSLRNVESAVWAKLGVTE